MSHIDSAISIYSWGSALLSFITTWWLYAEDIFKYMPFGWRVIAVIVVFGSLIAIFRFIFWTFQNIIKPKNKEPVMPRPQQNPFNEFIEQCKQCDPSYRKLLRPLNLAIPTALYILEKMRKERNDYSYTTLANVAFPYSWTSNMNQFHSEIRYVLDCLDRLDYIDQEMPAGKEKTYALIGMNWQNSAGDKLILFRNRYLEKFSDLNVSEPTDIWNGHKALGGSVKL